MPRRPMIVCSLMSVGLSLLCAAQAPSVAHADPHEIALVPSCAEIDTTRDTLDADARAVALRQLTRTLERADLLVVTTGCVDHYVASHEMRDGALVVRIAGPHGIRRMRNGSLDRLDDMYTRMVDSLLEPPPAPVAPANTNDTATDAADTASDGESDTESDASYAAPIERPSYSSGYGGDVGIDAVAPDVTEVTPDRLIYVDAGLGSLGFGYGLGYRRAASEHADVDFALTHHGGEQAGMTAFGVEALYLPHPRAVATPYIGGGMSLASQRDGVMTGGGLRAEVTAGYEFARDGASRWFAQIDLGLPLYELQSSTGEGDFRPTVSGALGVGF